MVHAQVNAHVGGRGAQRIHGQGHVVQRRDVGHANKAQAHTLAASVDAVVVGPLVQLPGLRQHQAGKVLAALGFVQAAPGIGQRRNLRQAPHLGLLQFGNALAHVLAVRLAEGGPVRTLLWGLVELVDPQAKDVHRLAGSLAAVALVHGTPGAVGQKQPFHQRRGQRGRGQQHPAAQQARPMHQPGEGGQVGHVEIVGLVQHQIAGQQAQHGGDLAAPAQAFGGRGEVVHGAHQQGCGNQRAGFGVVGQALQQRVLVVALK